MNCTEACPKDLNPARAIADIKRMIDERQRLSARQRRTRTGRLAWRCRRGMKELDLLLPRYLEERWARPRPG